MLACDTVQDNLMQVVERVRTGDNLAFDDLMPYFAPWIQKTIGRWHLPGVASDDL